MFHSYKAVAFAFTSGLIKNYDTFFDFAIRGEEGAELLCGGFPAEAADEELALGGVMVGDGSDGREDVGVAEDGGLDDGEELVVGEGGDEAASVVEGELG